MVWTSTPLVIQVFGSSFGRRPKILSCSCGEAYMLDEYAMRHTLMPCRQIHDPNSDPSCFCRQGLESLRKSMAEM